MRNSVLILGAILASMLMAPAIAAPARDVILVLDNSGSMRVNDPERLSVAAVTDFIRSQPAGTRVGIVIFADRPRLVQPLTAVSADTRAQLLNSVESLDFRGQRTETASAVERALYELRLQGREHADRAIVLMTDGIIDTGNEQRDLEKVRWLREMLTAQASDENVRIFGIAFTEKADYQLLQSVAQASGGEYFRALRAEDLGGVLDRIDRVLTRSFARTGTRAMESEPVGAAPIAAQRPIERLVFTETPPAGQAAAPDSTGSPASARLLPSETAIGDTEVDGPWRAILIVAAVVLLGVVGIGLLWGEEVSRLLNRSVRLRKESDDHGPRAVLYDVYDPSDIKRHELGAKPVVIGRVSGSDPAMDYIVVDERTIGRWHATVERRGQAFWIRDEGSVNGTFVNDQRVTAEHPLKHGDMVRVHRHEFEFVIPELFDSDRTMISPEAKMKRPDATPVGV